MPRVDLSQQKIVLAAVEVLRKKGLKGLTMLSLASRLKVKSPSLYNHIDGWDDLIRGIAIHGLHVLVSDMSRASKGKSGRAALGAVAEAFRQFSKRNPGLYSVTVRAPEKKDKEWSRASDAVLKVVADCMTEYRLSPSDTIHMLRAFRSTVHGFVSLEAAGGFGLPENVDESFRIMISSLIDGIEARTS